MPLLRFLSPMPPTHIRRRAHFWEAILAAIWALCLANPCRQPLLRTPDHMALQLSNGSKNVPELALDIKSRVTRIPPTSFDCVSVTRCPEPVKLAEMKI